MNYRSVLASLAIAVTLVFSILGCGGSGSTGGSSGTGGSGFSTVTIVNKDKIADAQFLDHWYGDPIPAFTPVHVNNTTQATRANHTTTRTVPASNETDYLGIPTGLSGTFTINGTDVTVLNSETWGEVINKINSVQGETGVRAEVKDNGGGLFSVDLFQTQYGAYFKILLDDSVGIIQAVGGSANASGVNAVSSVTLQGFAGRTFTGGQNGNDGLTMTDSEGNMIRLTVDGNAVANYVSCIVVN